MDPIVNRDVLPVVEGERVVRDVFADPQMGETYRDPETDNEVADDMLRLIAMSEAVNKVKQRGINISERHARRMSIDTRTVACCGRNATRTTAVGSYGSTMASPRSIPAEMDIAELPKFTAEADPDEANDTEVPDILHIESYTRNVRNFREHFDRTTLPQRWTSTRSPTAGASTGSTTAIATDTVGSTCRNRPDPSLDRLIATATTATRAQQVDNSIPNTDNCYY